MNEYPHNNASHCTHYITFIVNAELHHKHINAKILLQQHEPEPAVKVYSTNKNMFTQVI